MSAKMLEIDLLVLPERIADRISGPHKNWDQLVSEAMRGTDTQEA
jgi:hypothetical protein